MRRTRSFVMAAVILGAALVPGAVAGAAQPDKADKAARAKAEHERIVAYWTPERMRAAKPRDFERQPDGSFRQVATPKGKPGGGTKDKPGRGGGGGGTVSDPLVPITSGSSWGAGGEVLARTGKAYFRFTDGAGDNHGYVCSGAVAHDGDTGNGFSLVLTAGHCVYDSDWGFATYWMFIPDFDSNPDLNTRDCTQALLTHGCWTAQALVAHEGFTSETGFTTRATQHDFAFAVVGGAEGGSGGPQLDMTVGAYRMEFSAEAGQRFSAFGYPAAGKYKGNDLTYCSGTLTRDPYNRDDATNELYEGPDDNWGMACKMTGGSSGGPWIRTEATTDDRETTLGADGKGGEISSLNSYGYTGVSFMFGPVFDDEAGAVYDSAKEGPIGDRVVS